VTDSPLVFVDVETDGLGPARLVWEIGMIRRDTIGEKSTRIFVDVDVSDAEPGALDIGRYYQRHPNGRAACGLPDLGDELYSPADAADIVSMWTFDNAVVIGCTVNFDTEALAELLRAHKLEPGWNYHVLDVTTFAAGWIRGRQLAARFTASESGWYHVSVPLPRLGEPVDVDPAGWANLDVRPPFKSRTIAAALGIVQPAGEEHTALGDARLAARLYDAVTIN
jgi:hypothetical protein